MTSELRKLLRYDVWANRETLRSFSPGPAPARSMRWMGHIVGAELLWLARLRRERHSMPVWPDLDVRGCAAGLEDLSRSWDEYLGDGDPARLSEQ